MLWWSLIRVYSSVMSERGFRNPHSLKQTSLSDIWEDLHSGIRHVFNRQNMPKARRIELHTYPPNLSSFAARRIFILTYNRHVYNYCNTMQQDEPKKNLSGGGAGFVGLKLYRKIEEFLMDHINSLKLVCYFICLLHA